MNRMGRKTKKVAKEVAALKAEVAELKTEMAHLRTEQGAKLKAEIDSLSKKLHAEMEQTKRRSKRGEREVKGQVHALEEKAGKATGEAKAAFEARVTRIRKRLRKPVASSEQPQAVAKPDN